MKNFRLNMCESNPSKVPIQQYLSVANNNYTSRRKLAEPSRSYGALCHILNCEDGSNSIISDQMLTVEAKFVLRRSRSASPSMPFLLTSEQQQIIRKSWTRVPKAKIGKAINEEMISRYGGSSKDLFPAEDILERHSRYFIDLIQSAVDNLSDLEGGLQGWLELIGKGHSKFEIKTKHWECFGEALSGVISSFLGKCSKRRETMHSWHKLFSFITDRLVLASTSYRNSNYEFNSPRIQLLKLVTNDLPTQNQITIPMTNLQLCPNLPQ